MRQPPENSETARAWSAVEKPRPDRIAAARAGAECASISTSRVWISAMRSRIGGVLGFGEKCGALQVGGQHDVDQAVRAGRRFLQQPADLGALRAR